MATTECVGSRGSFGLMISVQSEMYRSRNGRHFLFCRAHRQGAVLCGFHRRLESQPHRHSPGNAGARPCNAKARLLQDGAGDPDLDTYCSEGNLELLLRDQCSYCTVYCIDALWPPSIKLYRVLRIAPKQPSEVRNACNRICNDPPFRCDRPARGRTPARPPAEAAPW